MLRGSDGSLNCALTSTVACGTNEDLGITAGPLPAQCGVQALAFVTCQNNVAAVANGGSDGGTDGG